MKQFFIGLFMTALLCACRKEDSQVASTVTVTRIEMTCGDIPLVCEPSNIPNNTDYYEFGGNAGNYFGLIADFPLNSSHTLQLRFGNMITSDHFITEEDIRRLLIAGRKSLGSLGAFTSYPSLIQGAAEIAYTDPQGTRWCSTILKEYVDNGHLRTKAITPQSGGYVQVDSLVLHHSTQGLNPSFWVSGSVNTLLYEVNGTRTELLTGNFSGLIGME